MLLYMYSTYIFISLTSHLPISSEPKIFGSDSKIGFRI